MKNLKKTGMYFLACIILSIFSFKNLHAQVQTAKPGVSMIANSGGYYEYLPQGYDPNSSQTYPLIIMLHGIGELGDGSSTKLPMVLANGVPTLIKNGQFPTSISYNGQDFKFIVITPQFKQWPSAADIGNIISYCQLHYKVDNSRIYLTGISMGGGALWTAISTPSIASKVAAAVVFAGASAPTQTLANVVADNNIGVWMLHNDKDGTVTPNNTYNWYNEIIARNPSAPVKKSIFSSTSHNCWSMVYPTNYKENDINIFQFMLMFKKGEVVPSLPANKPPVSNAGADKSVTLPTSSLTLTGSGTDTDNGIASYAWTKISGPSTPTFSAATSASTSVSGLIAGTYVFRLKVTDKAQVSTTDDVTVTVNNTISTSTETAVPPTSNTTPTKPTSFYASAGADQTITLPLNSVTVNGKGTDVGGTIIKYVWSKIAGPAQYTFNDSTAASTVISNLATGSYTFRLTVYDASGLITSDAMIVNVNPGSSSSVGIDTVAISTISIPVTPPQPTTFIASAGDDITIAMPVDSVSLNGKVTDIGGTVTKYQWTKVSGPVQYTFTDSTNASTLVKKLAVGTYTFRLTVTDACGLTTYDDMIVIVNNPPKPTSFYASAGADIKIKLPLNSVTLNGKATDIGGTVTGFKWIKIGGPVQYTLTDSTKASTTVTNLVAGTYTFRLMAYDASGIYTSDAIDVIVSAADSIVSATTKEASSNLVAIASVMSVNPEATSDRFTLTVNNDQTGIMMVQLINSTGTTVKSYMLQKPAKGSVQSYLSLGDVASGNYTLNVEVGNYKESKTIVKL